jgi:two-component system NarL family response regulator
MPTPIRVLLADDHRLLTQALRVLFSQEADLEVIGEARSGEAAVAPALAAQPDVVVMDHSMPGMGGVEATRQILARCERTRVVGLSTHADQVHGWEMLQAGAGSYVIKAGDVDELLQAIRGVVKGHKYVSPPLAGWVIVGALQQRRGQRPTVHGLGDRETQVVRFIAEGESSKTIAGRMGISASTVEVHRKNIMKKLSVQNTAELTRWAVRNGVASG